MVYVPSEIFIDALLKFGASLGKCGTNFATFLAKTSTEKQNRDKNLKRNSNKSLWENIANRRKLRLCQCTYDAVHTTTQAITSFN